MCSFTSIHLRWCAYVICCTDAMPVRVHSEQNNLYALNHNWCTSLPHPICPHPCFPRPSHTHPRPSHAEHTRTKWGEGGGGRRSSLPWCAASQTGPKTLCTWKRPHILSASLWVSSRVATYAYPRCKVPAAPKRHHTPEGGGVRMSHGTWDLPPQVGLRTHTATVCGEIVPPQSFDVRRIGFVLTQLGGVGGGGPSTI